MDAFVDDGFIAWTARWAMRSASRHVIDAESGQAIRARLAEDVARVAPRDRGDRTWTIGLEGR